MKATGRLKKVSFITEIERTPFFLMVPRSRQHQHKPLSSVLWSCPRSLRRPPTQPRGADSLLPPKPKSLVYFCCQRQSPKSIEFPSLYSPDSRTTSSAAGARLPVQDIPKRHPEVAPYLSSLPLLLFDVLES
jgi:hypothetical protein